MELCTKHDAAKNNLKYKECLTTMWKTIRATRCSDPILMLACRHKCLQSNTSHMSSSLIECRPPEGPTQEAILLTDTMVMDMAEGNSPTPITNTSLAPTANSNHPTGPPDITALIAASIQQAILQVFKPIQNQLDNLKANQDYLHAKMEDKTNAVNSWGSTAESHANNRPYKEYTKEDHTKAAKKQAEIEQCY